MNNSKKKQKDVTALRPKFAETSHSNNHQRGHYVFNYNILPLLNSMFQGGLIMSIYVLTWLKQDLEAIGDNIGNYSLLDLEPLIKEYNNKFNR